MAATLLQFQGGRTCISTYIRGTGEEGADVAPVHPEVSCKLQKHFNVSLLQTTEFQRSVQEGDMFNVMLLQ